VVRFEDLVADTGTTVASAIAAVGEAVDPDRLSRAIEQAQASDTRFNVGKAGRGIEIEARYGDRIAALQRHFPDTDFTPLLQR